MITPFHTTAKKTGFTLVETMLAAAIAALVMTAALGAFRQVSRSRHMARCYSELAAHGRYGLNLIRDDLANIFRSQFSGKMHLVGIPLGTDADADDSLIMYVLAQPQSADDNESWLNDIFEVEYTLAESADTPALIRRWAPVEDFEIGNADGISIDAARYVRTLKFEYFDGLEWIRRWNQTGALPQKVRVSMELVKNTLNKDVSLVISQEISLEPLPRIISDDSGSSR
ncbi:MAG: prepilin-type N-terminal cleavage/methylation domain-containing protein [Planctomycetes bacterium]|nr:prepilin-type N-terminal cleavage/methylation domain-containing protein [Planctomycetota bacterium]